MSRSLSELPNYVTNAFHLVPEEHFVPENIVLGSYTFLPWVRSGVGAAVVAPAAGQLRATIAIAVAVQADGQPDQSAKPPTPLAVRGPGDVVGIDERQVIRCYPSPGTSNAEDSFLAHVEFDRPELPWLFTPAAPAGDRLTPWIVLIVAAAGRYELAPGRGGRPPQISVRKSELQAIDAGVDDPWAWAHAQVVGPADSGPTIPDRLTPSYAAANLSRLVCPRHLAPDTQYLACVVPAYDAGVQTGLGTGSPGTLAPAWTRAADASDADNAVLLPVYSSWRFGTGPAGDFESLAEKLAGVPAPWQVGRRVTDVAFPKGGLPDLAPDDAGRVQTIHAPLVSPQKPSAQSDDPTEVAAAHAETATWPAAETDALREVLNTPDRLAGTPPDVHAPPDRPVIGPELYARFHAAVSRLEKERTDWFAELNVRPEHRVVAGLGTRVVQMDQEPLMQSAWAQVGAIDDANRQLRWAQMARFVGDAFHERHVQPLAFGDALGFTRRVQSRILAADALTVAAQVADSNLADAAVTATFRRVTRPLGGIARFASTQRLELARVVATDGIARDMQRPYRDLDGVAGVSELAANALDFERVAPVLGVSTDQVAATVVAHGQTLVDAPSVPEAFGLAVDGGARTTSGTDRTLARRAAEQVIDHIERAAPREPLRDPARAVGLASLLESLVAVEGDLGQKAAELARRLRRGIDAEAPEPNQQLAGILSSAREVDDATVVRSFTPIAGDLVAVDWPGTPVRPALGLDAATLVDLVRPAVTVTARVRGRFGATLPSWLPPDWFDDLFVQPIMAAPVFTRPMYQALDAYSREWLLPGLSKFPQPDVVTVLVSNARFIEAFLTGLSHEMARELLWRGYPTDQRGTYFRRFWNGASDELVQDIHRFTSTPLGEHVVASLSGRVVLMVRGELIRRYPDALVLSMLAGTKDAEGRPIFEDPAGNPNTKVLAPILFHGHLEPDIVLVGFDLTVSEMQAAAAAGHGWWFLIAEHPTAPRFGLREEPSADNLRDPLGWGDLAVRLGGPAPIARGFLDARTAKLVRDSDAVGAPQATFGAHAAATAHVLLRDPVRAAFEGLTLLGPTGIL
ncbi:MAG: hypothetical protein JWL83_2822 [Actinomycetia bacterium]|nr:hypothetical protein [Actinomycetes bacterium]